MSNAAKAPQRQAQDRKQMRAFESTYEYLAKALQSFDPSVEISSEPLRVDVNRDKIARGAVTITMRHAHKSARLPISIQSTHVWVKGEKVCALPKTAPKNRMGYYFENRESAASYFIAVVQALLRAHE